MIFQTEAILKIAENKLEEKYMVIQDDMKARRLKSSKSPAHYCNRKVVDSARISAGPSHPEDLVGCSPHLCGPSPYRDMSRERGEQE